MNDETLDRLAGLRAVADQACASMPEHARLVAAYHRELIAAGLSEDEALVLTVYFQTSYLESILSADGGDDDTAA